MKSFYRHQVAILPLLSLLALSPSVMESKVHKGRSIASVKEEVKGHPKYEALVSKIRPESLMKDSNVTQEKFIEKRNALKAHIQKEREDFKKDLGDEKVVQEQRNKVESLVIDILLVEGSLKELQEKKSIEQTEEEASVKLVSESKDIIESLLSDLESNEILVAKGKEPKKEDKPVVIADNKEEPKKEEPKKEEPKVCVAEEQNKILTTQIEEMMKQNQQIIQAMLGMTQMMVSMHQQQQQMQNPFYQNGPGWNQSPYQYHQPQAAGNWVYYPQGFQPQQQNIFAQPQMPVYQPQVQPQQGGIYPDQMHQQQRPMSQLPQNWSLQPDPRFQVQQFTPGTFGSEPFGFNMGNVVPTITQL